MPSIEELTAEVASLNAEVRRLRAALGTIAVAANGSPWKNVVPENPAALAAPDSISPLMATADSEDRLNMVVALCFDLYRRFELVFLAGAGIAEQADRGLTRTSSEQVQALQAAHLSKNSWAETARVAAGLLDELMANHRTAERHRTVVARLLGE